MNILITGATGFIGSILTQRYLNKNYKVIILARKQSKSITPSDNITTIYNLNELANDFTIDCIINLAGSPINKHWSDTYKKKLIDSRINTTKNIISFLQRLQNKPKLLISASAVGYYGSQDHNARLTENSDFNPGFTHDLCSTWESEAKKAEEFGVRTCIARLGVVLGKNGGALSQLLLPFKLGLGGRIGNGEQMFSWVALDDVINAFDFFMSNKNTHGIYNLTAPNPVSNKEFTHTLGKILHRPTIFNIPSFVIKLIFGEMGEELLLNGQAVIPQKLQQEGFKFQYPKLENALLRAL